MVSFLLTDAVQTSNYGVSVIPMGLNKRKTRKMAIRINLLAALVAGVALATAGAASAADLGDSSDAARSGDSDAQTVVNWSGFYVGLNAGYDRSRSDWTYTNNLNTTGHVMNGGVAGVHAGFQRQMGRVVVGIEGDVDAAMLDGKSSCPNSAYTCSTQVSGLESLRGRLGFASGRWLAYGTGGVAFEQIKHHAADPTVPINNVTANGKSLHGWVAGAGLEVMLAPNASLGLEYLHYDFSKQNLDLINDQTGVADGNVDFAAQASNVVRLRYTITLDGAHEHSPMK
jgi:outer membrane immunogenic protein